MDQLDFKLDMFMRALMICMENPSINMKWQLQKNAMYLRDAIREHSQQMEKQITENVLKAISIKLESGDALNEIKVLKNAIDTLGK